MLFISMLVNGEMYEACQQLRIIFTIIIKCERLKLHNLGY